jgi:hypothetical protein
MPPITNGRMGGLLMFREQVLEQARGALDTLAKTVVQEVNAVHRSGLDAEGRLGGDLFRMDTSSRGPAAGIVMAIQDANRVAAAGQFRVINNSLNTGNAQARVAFTAPEYAGVSGLVGDLAAGQSPRIGQESIRVGTSPPFAPIGTIPTGSQDVVIALNNPSSGLSLQVITRDGRHVLGQALTNAERDLLMQGQQGMEAGATYNADQINGAVDTNPNTPTPYMNMDLFVGAKGDVRLLQRFNPATGDALAPEAAAARLTANAAPPTTLGSIPAGRSSNTFVQPINDPCGGSCIPAYSSAKYACCQLLLLGSMPLAIAADRALSYATLRTPVYCMAPRPAPLPASTTSSLSSSGRPVSTMMQPMNPHASAAVSGLILPLLCRCTSGPVRKVSQDCRLASSGCLVGVALTQRLPSSPSSSSAPGGSRCSTAFQNAM